MNENDIVSFERIVNVPKRGIGESSVKKLREFINISNKSISETLNSLDDLENISPRIKSKLTDFKDLITELKSFSIQGPSEAIQKLMEKTGYKMD